MRINNVYKYSTLIVCIKITSPFLTLFDLPLLLLRVSDNSVNTFTRQKYWNFELDLKDIYIFFPFCSKRFSNIWDLPSISSYQKEIQRTNCGNLVKWLPEICTRKWPGSMMGSMQTYSEEQISSTQTRIVATRVLNPKWQWLVAMHPGCLQISQMAREASIA